MNLCPFDTNRLASGTHHFRSRAKSSKTLVHRQLLFAEEKFADRLDRANA